VIPLRLSGELVLVIAVACLGKVAGVTEPATAGRNVTNARP